MCKCVYDTDTIAQIRNSLGAANRSVTKCASEVKHLPSARRHIQKASLRYTCQMLLNMSAAPLPETVRRVHVGTLVARHLT